MRTLEENEDNNSSIDDEDHQDTNIIIGANVDGQEVVEILEEDENCVSYIYYLHTYFREWFQKIKAIN